MLRIFAALLADRSGTNAIEYSLIGSLVAIAMITGLVALGTNLSAMFTNTANLLNP